MLNCNKLDTLNITFYPFQQASNHGRGKVLISQTHSDTYDTLDFSDVPYLESVVIENGTELVIFAVNRSQVDSMDLMFNPEGYNVERIIEHRVLSGAKIKDINDKDNMRVEPHVKNSVKIDGNTIKIELDSLSWNMIRIKIK